SGGVTTTMSMPGMMSDADMQQLTAASGTAFDRLFLQQMIVHHQGALEMADTEIAQGSNTAALTLALAIKTSQTAEITEMQQMLKPCKSAPPGWPVALPTGHPTGGDRYTRRPPGSAVQLAGSRPAGWSPPRHRLTGVTPLRHPM
ncbi:MAG TPA: DUF305 domain-containing protein, partial [Nakamurella sp.]|nr:DUF305 domain-containing protein [Nakamurella sp.]